MYNQDATKMALLTSSWTADTLCVCAVFWSIFFVFLRYSNSYWDRKSFKTLPNGHYVFGHFLSTFLQKETIGDFFLRLYNRTTEPFIGIYGVFRPILLVRDPELIRSILVKDFNSFTDRGA